MSFINDEIKKHLQLTKEGIIFEGAKHKPNNKELEDNNEIKNLFLPIRNEVQRYFSINDIQWWGGSIPGNYLSSQIACLNHLFYIKNNKSIILNIIKSIDKDFEDVYLIPCDKEELRGYVSFEVVSQKDYLNEGEPNRGRNCTSLDAIIYAKHKNGKKYLILIEWKYTEKYGNTDKSTDSAGDRRLKRYKDLIDSSKQLKSLKNYKGAVYFYEPFYQLMRQTLWAEAVINHKDTELFKADDYYHLHIVASGNKELKDFNYEVTNQNMEQSWKSMLVNPNKYVLMSPEELFKPVISDEPELVSYLKTRYWN